MEPYQPNEKGLHAKFLRENPRYINEPICWIEGSQHGGSTVAECIEWSTPDKSNREIAKSNINRRYRTITKLYIMYKLCSKQCIGVKLGFGDLHIHVLYQMKRMVQNCSPTHTLDISVPDGYGMYINCLWYTLRLLAVICMNAI